MEDDYSHILSQWSEHEMAAARSLANFLNDKYKPTSVIDIGCGAGMFLLEFVEREVETLGVDGEKAGGKLIPNFIVADLRMPETKNLVKKKYDLAICLEVGEHIKTPFTDNFVDIVSSSSTTIVFSAAKPGQVGTHHYNCQPKRYWVEKFGKHGFMVSGLDSLEAVDYMRSKSEFDNSPWLEENIMILKNDDSRES